MLLAGMVGKPRIMPQLDMDVLYLRPFFKGKHQSKGPALFAILWELDQLLSWIISCWRLPY